MDGRTVLIPVAAVMAHRAQWLTTEPFEPAANVPDALALIYAAGAAVLVVLLVRPTWQPATVVVAVMAVCAPYVLFLTWVLSAFPYRTVRGTVWDLALIPVLVTASWARLSSQTLALRRVRGDA